MSLVLLSCLLFSKAAMSQVNSVPNCFLLNNEKVFVQLDRHVLLTGEDLNFNCFIVNASTHRESVLSKVVYFELSDARNQVVFAWRSNYAASAVSGSVRMPDSLMSGLYILRAYTNWMRNFSPAFFFSTTLIISKMGDEVSANYNVPALSASYDVIAEGGKCLYGIKNNIGVCVSPSRKIKVEIVNNLNEVVSSCETDKYGRGTTAITPQAGQVYAARFVDLAGNELASKQLMIEYAGYSFSVKSSINALYMHIEALQDKSTSVLNLVVRQRGREVLSKNITISNGISDPILSLDSFPSGILDLVLLDKTGRIVAERLAPVLHSAINLDLGLNSSEMKTNQSQELTIQSPYASHQASIAISVSLHEPFNAVNTSINAYLHFASELPNVQLFSDSLSLAQLDLLLQTSSISSYLWNKEKFDTIRHCTYVAENKGYVLEGKVLSKNTLTPIVNKQVLLSVVDSIPLIKTCTTDQKGRFYFRLNSFFDNRKMLLQLDDPTATFSVDWSIDKKSFIQEPTSVSIASFDEDLKKYISICRDLQVVHAIYSEDLVSVPKVSVNSTSIPFKPNLVLFPADYSELKNFRELASNILPAISFRKKNNGYELRAYDLFNRIDYEHNAGLLLNGIPFYDLAFLSTLGTNEIQRIEAYNSLMLLGDCSFYGLVSVYTFDKKMPKSFTENANFNFFTNDVVLDIPVNMYQTSTVVDSKLPCFYRSLYVKSKTLDAGKVASVTLNASLFKGDYDIVVQGISDNGDVFEKVKHVVVK